MQMAEMFDLSLRVYRTLGWRILAASIVPTLFSLAGVAFLFQYVLPGFFTTNQGTKESGQVMEAAMNMLLGVFVAGPLMLIGIALATTYIAPLVSDFMHGLPPDLNAARQAQWKNAPRMLWLSIRESLIGASGVVVGGLFLFLSYASTFVTAPDNVISGLVLVLGIVALCGGAIVILYVVSIHAIVAPISSLEGVTAKIAGKRSKELMKSRPYQGSGYESIWALYMLILVLALILGLGTAMGLGALGVTNWAGALNLRQLRPVVEGAADLLPYFLSLWVIIPVWAVTVTIVYFERRVRLEGYDIEALAADVWHPDHENPIRA
jgi:hypothetical protein